MADKPKAGDTIIIETAYETIQGVLMPQEDESAVIVKLQSGYNMGVARDKIKSMTLKEAYSPPAEKPSEAGSALAAQKDLPMISILHMGGTIASKVDYRTGGVIARFSPEEILKLFPELRDIANIRSTLIANMFSEDIRFEHYKLMLDAIEKEIAAGVKGIIITHGTDTMHYSSAALAFALENCPIPILLVGSQRSSDRGSSDAAMNLLCAAKFLTKTDFCGVGICMHENMDDDSCLILPACRTRKMHTSRRDAFRPVNDVPIARVQWKDEGSKDGADAITYIKKDYPKKSEGKLTVRNGFHEHVGLIKCHPNMHPKQFAMFRGYKGLVIEGTGLGQAPVGSPDVISAIHQDILKEIKGLVESGCIVVMTSQCIFGGVQMHVYSDAIDLTDAGVIPGEDMLTEVAFVKLAWALGNFKQNEAAQLMRANLRGEMSEKRGTEFLDKNWG